MPGFICNASVLRTLPIFSSLADADLAQMLPYVQHRRFPPRSLIMRAGEVADGLYVILSGQVRVALTDPQGRESIVSMLGPQDFFGELGLVDGGRRTADVHSQGTCEVLFVPRRALLDCLRRDPGTALSMLCTIVGRLSDAYRKIQRLALMNVHARVAQVLLETSRETNGEWRVDTGAEQIAAMVGASREMVSRVVGDMIRRGLVRRHKRKLIVLDRVLLGEQQSGTDLASTPLREGMQGSSNRCLSEALA